MSNHEPILFLDKEPIATRLPFRYNKSEEENTMTIRELAENLILHAEEPQSEIDLARAAEIISWLDPDSGLPDNLTPETFMEAFNDLIRNHPNQDI